MRFPVTAMTAVLNLRLVSRLPCVPSSLDNGRRSPRKLSAPSSLGCSGGSADKRRTPEESRRQEYRRVICGGLKAGACPAVGRRCPHCDVRPALRRPRCSGAWAGVFGGTAGVRTASESKGRRFHEVLSNACRNGNRRGRLTRDERVCERSGSLSWPNSNDDRHHGIRPDRGDEPS
jgi:hypothetical protein